MATVADPNKPSWEEARTHRTKYPTLTEDTSVDVAIIGGGITGILNAYALAKAGKRVALLERAEIANNATAMTTAFITKVIDTNLVTMADLFGNESAKMVWDSGQEAVHEIEHIVDAEGIACDFKRCSNYLFASTRNQVRDLDEDFRAYRHLRMNAVRKEHGDDLGFPNYGYIEIPDQAKFHPLKFVLGVAKAAVENGAQIFEDTPALDIERTTPIAVKTPKATVFAGNVIFATYSPFTNHRTRFKKGMYRSYVLELELPPNGIKEGTYEDMGAPYHYFRIDKHEGADDLIVGGEDHKDIFGKSLVEESFRGLERFATRKIVPKLPYHTLRRWDGPILEPSDGLPLIGLIQPNYYVATAFSGNGMTYSAISAILIRDLILGNANVWEKLYDPKRTILHPKRLASKALDYIEEFFGGAAKNLIQNGD